MTFRQAFCSTDNFLDQARIDSSTSVAHTRGILDSEQTWNANVNVQGQWLQIDLGTMRAVSGTVTQGQHDMPNRISRYAIPQSCYSNLKATPIRHLRNLSLIYGIKFCRLLFFLFLFLLGGGQLRCFIELAMGGNLQCWHCHLLKFGHQ